ncbi:hypothetical protein [Zavarzinella formosa]|uniref:hypothetical protein n=1 Tax=Zavarzinella formosa TaxID=360055 RepID=UPI0003792DD0|nr:hypothetical protein [Zavarzinella formosa]
MNEVIPAKPRGSDIREDAGPAGLTLSWGTPSGRFRRLLSAAYLSFFLALWSLGEVAAVWALVTGSVSPLIIIWLIFWTLAGTVFGRIFWLLLQRGRPESITLGTEMFVYDPGTSPVIEPYVLGGYWTFRPMPGTHGFYRELFSRRRPTEAGREAMAGLRLDRKGERQRLSFDVGAERREIGAGLREPDREWLFAVLQHWRRGDGFAKPNHDIAVSGPLES